MWRWLTYGSNATAVGVAISAIGLLVVTLYTLYTRHLMMLAWETRRGELYPLIVLENEERGEAHLDVTLSNLGKGALINSFQWQQMVSARFDLSPVLLEHAVEVERHLVGSLMPQGTRTFQFPLQPAGTSFLFVLEGTDAVGGRHQFCFLNRWVRPGAYEVTVQMNHPQQFRTLGAKTTSQIRRFWKGMFQTKRRSVADV